MRDMFFFVSYFFCQWNGESIFFFRRLFALWRTCSLVLLELLDARKCECVILCMYQLFFFGCLFLQMSRPMTYVIHRKNGSGENQKKKKRKNPSTFPSEEKN